MSRFYAAANSAAMRGVYGREVPKMFLSPNRWKHFAAMILIGDGVMALVHPQKDALAWKTGPQPWQELMHALHERPGLTRMIGAAQIVGGVWWALSHPEEGSKAS